jgi:hypothetical protein
MQCVPWRRLDARAGAPVTVVVYARTLFRYLVLRSRDIRLKTQGFHLARSVLRV